jgi:hypothetical protein
MCFEQGCWQAHSYANSNSATGRISVLLLGLRAAHVSASSSDDTSSVRLLAT